jgi:Tfp pilus assembly protein PilX
VLLSARFLAAIALVLNSDFQIHNLLSRYIIAALFDPPNGGCSLGVFMSTLRHMKVPMAYTSTSKKSRSSGIALVTVLVITVVVLALITVVSGLAVRSSRVTSSDITATSLAQMADGWSDVGRIAIAENFSASKLQATAWLNMIASNRATTPLINPTNAKVSALAGVKSATIDGVTLRWKIVGISKSTDSKAWLLLASTAVDAQGRSQTVTRKVEFASNSIFDLAILTKKTDCMFCHLRVDGDVGSIGFFRPGWGIDAQDNSDGKNRNGQNSGGPSSITGNVYVSTTISADGAAGTANGATIGGTKNVNYNGDKLPKNSSGQAEFPGLDRALAESSATGSITGGSIQGVPIGGSFASATPVTSVGGVYDGNLVLIGTDANPIVLDSDIYVKGDVVIKGVVKGRGAIYSSRNMYVAGNLTNKNKADKPGAVGGVCATIPDKDACARANITAGKDEVRLSAGNNIVLGDYTDSKDGVVSRQNKQANDYMRSQFELWTGNNRYVRKGNSEELSYVAPVAPATVGKYYDQLGQEVVATEVKTLTGDPYNDLMSPGTTDSSGNFSQWMSDAQYQSILGTESIPTNTWRSNIGPGDFNQSSNALKKAAIIAELEAAGLPANANTQVSDLATRIRDYRTADPLKGITANDTSKKINYSGTDKNNNPVSGTVYFDGGSIRVAVNEARTYKAESTAVEAFLYANERVGGKLSPRGGYLNGGVIAGEVGILATGKNDGADWWLTNMTQAEKDKYNKCNTTTRPTDSSADAYKNGTNCDYAINYDYRLRNGGYGYNLYKGKTGTTSDWNLDQNGTYKVAP